MTLISFLLLFIFINAVCSRVAHADDFGDGSDIEPTTPVTGYSMKRASPTPSPAPTIPPTTSQNSVPIASAGPNQVVFTGALVVLDASKSYDTDGAIASYIWKQLSGAPIEILSHRTKHPSFSAGDTVGSYVFAVTVRDTIGAVAIDVVTILVRQNPNIVLAPVPTITIQPLATPLPSAILSFPLANILFVILGGILLLLVGIVIKVALRPEGS